MELSFAHEDIGNWSKQCRARAFGVALIAGLTTLAGRGSVPVTRTAHATIPRTARNPTMTHKTSLLRLTAGAAIFAGTTLLAACGGPPPYSRTTTTQESKTSTPAPVMTTTTTTQQNSQQHP